MVINPDSLKDYSDLMWPLLGGFHSKKGQLSGLSLC